MPSICSSRESGSTGHRAGTAALHALLIHGQGGHTVGELQKQDRGDRQHDECGFSDPSIKTLRWLDGPSQQMGCAPGRIVTNRPSPGKTGLDSGLYSRV